MKKKFLILLTTMIMLFLCEVASVSTPTYTYENFVLTISNMEDVAPPRTVKGITGYADISKYKHYKITTLRIGSGAKTIGGFSDFDNMDNVDIPTTLTTVYVNAFQNCSLLKTISTTDNLISIGNSAFQNCKKLESFAFGKKLTDIGSRAFENTALSEIVLGDNITHIGADAFNNTPYYNNAANWYNNALYSGKYLLAVNKDAEKISLRQGTTFIADDVFKECVNLKMLTIPISITNIDDSAFDGCDNIVINAAPDSYAYAYAQNHNIPTFVDYDISNAEVTGVTDVEYPNYKDSQNIVVTLNGETLENNYDYKIWDYSNINKGTSKFLIVGIGDYYGCIKKTYEVTKTNMQTSPTTYSIDVGTDKKILLGDTIKFSTDIETVLACVKDEQTCSYYYLQNGITFSETGTHYVGCGGYITYSNYEVGSNGVARLVKHKEQVTRVSTITVVDPNDTISKIEATDFQTGERDKIYIHASATPYYSDHANLVWASSDESVATVDDYGVVTLNSAGYTVITATADSGEYMTAELDLQPLNIANAKITSFENTEADNYSVVLTDKYGDLRDGIDYAATYTVKDNIVTVKCEGQGLYNGIVVGRYDLNENQILDVPYETTVTENDTNYNFNIFSSSYKDGIVYVAVYDTDGTVISVGKEQVNTTGNTTVEVEKSAADKTAKIFVWTENMQPITSAESVDL